MSDQTDVLTKWTTQLLKGYLELHVMVQLTQKEAYGGEILLRIQQHIDISEGTLYPLLNRMQRNGWLTSRWQTPKAQGHARRYYSLADEGGALLPEMQKTFQTLQWALSEETQHDKK